MDNIFGKHVYLTAIDVKDAEYTLNLRNSGRALETMPKIDNTIEQQAEWIKYQRSIPNDYFFKIRNYDEKEIGIVSFYDIDEANMIAEIGRYISNGTSVENVEALILVIDACVNNYNVDKILLHVLKKNKTVYNFWKNFGAKVIRDMDLNGLPATEMILYKQDYTIYRDQVYSLIFAE